MHYLQYCLEVLSMYIVILAEVAVAATVTVVAHAPTMQTVNLFGLSHR